MQVRAAERIIVVRPSTILRNAAGANDRERYAFQTGMRIILMSMAVQPEHNAATPSHRDQIFQIAQAMENVFASACGKPDGIMGHEDARPWSQASQQFFQPRQLR